MRVSLAHYYEAYDRVLSLATEEKARRTARLTAVERVLGVRRDQGNNGFKRMQRCRTALNALDRRGWERSFHQRHFHDNFIRACARIFFKTDPRGSFARNHQRVLELNGWDTLSQEILISTPRRFGKTISVSMFAAAMLYSCPNLTLSIYSTCKRVSQLLLRKVQSFLDMIFLELATERFPKIRVNMEEIVLKGPESEQDVRTVNSYPSKVQSKSGSGPRGSCRQGSSRQS